MPALRSRLLLGACALLTAIGLIVVALPDDGKPRASVGTEGDGRERGSAPDLDPTPGPTQPVPDESAVVAGDGNATDAGSGPSVPASTPSNAPTPSETTSSTMQEAPRSLAGRIAFLRSDGASPPQIQMWSIKPDGSDRRLEPLSCPSGFVFGSAFDASPDGSLIARDCGSPGLDEPGTGIVIQDVATGAARSVLRHPLMDSMGVRWSPDGASIAVTSSSGLLKIVDVDDLEVHDVAVDRAIGSTVVTWSPDSRFLVSEDGWVIDVATGVTTDLTGLADVIPENALSWSTAIRWAPDGHLYVKSSYAFGPVMLDYVLDRVNPITGVRTNVVHQSAYMGRVEFLPGGRLLLADGNTQAYSIEADGTDRSAVPLTFSDFSWTSPRG